MFVSVLCVCICVACVVGSVWVVGLVWLSVVCCMVGVVPDVFGMCWLLLVCVCL